MKRFIIATGAVITAATLVALQVVEVQVAIKAAAAQVLVFASDNRIALALAITFLIVVSCIIVGWRAGLHGVSFEEPRQ